MSCTGPAADEAVTVSNGAEATRPAFFRIVVDGARVRVVGPVALARLAAPLYGGETTTVVADLSRYEDRTAVVSLHANSRKLGSRTITVDCRQPSPGAGTGPPGAQPRAMTWCPVRRAR